MKKPDDLLTALRAYAKQRKDSPPFRRYAPEFAKRLKKDPGDAVAWLAHRYVEHYSARAEEAASERQTLLKWQKEAKRKRDGQKRTLKAALTQVQHLAVHSRIDTSIGKPKPEPRTRITDRDLVQVKRVIGKALRVIGEIQGNMLDGPPSRHRGRPDDLHALDHALIELLRAAGLSKASAASHVGRLRYPDNRTRANQRAASIQVYLSRR